ncbi:hypothetical protein G7046_g1826 [Stylonectria norvegica]|nr:hypothetical protein G7046_g1826 [Stylonectria norvegica]
MANESAKTLKALHVPGSPIIFANVWDIASFNIITSLNTANAKPIKAIATASWAIAASVGVTDPELTYEQNIAAIAKIAPLAKAAGLPLSVDLQDGYGSRIASTVTAAVKLGAAGANIEDAPFDDPDTLYGVEEQVERLRTALKAAADVGMPDFVLNARCDIFHIPGELDDASRLKEAIVRGRAYLGAGATTVFYWGGGGRGLRDAQVQTLVKELDGRVAVIALQGDQEGALTMADLANIGVARISIGPRLFRVAAEAMKTAAMRLLGGGSP